MSDRAAMLRSILDAPEDDAPKLVYADWLDERGEVERASLIRLDGWTTYERKSPGRWRLSYRTQRDRTTVASSPPSACEHIKRLLPIGIRKYLDSITVHRGFVHSVCCTADACSLHLDTIRKEHPVQRVTFTTLPDAYLCIDGVGLKYCTRRAVLSGRRFQEHAFGREDIRTVAELIWPGTRFELPQDGNRGSSTDHGTALLQEVGVQPRLRLTGLVDLNAPHPTSSREAAIEWLAHVDSYTADTGRELVTRLEEVRRRIHALPPAASS
jgi:uncharacterized protein (TIGR02996 family)